MTTKIKDDLVRNVYRQQIFDIINANIEETKMSYGEKKEMAKMIERSCNNEAIIQAKQNHITPINWNNQDFCSIYSAISYRIIQNLDPNSTVGSSYLLNKLANGKIKPINIAKKTSAQLCPEKSADIIKEKNRRLKETIEVRTTQRYPCPNCKKREAQYKNVQLRSLDEGYNLSLTCKYCSHKWVI